MTVGYGGISEHPFTVKWAKIFRVSRSHTGKYHAWGPLGGLCGAARTSEGPSRRTRERQPHKACRDCLQAVS